MDSIKGQDGIQMLLTAEQEAQQIISSARNLKLTRLKQAKEEAEREAARYHASLEAEYQKKISESTGYSGMNVKRLEDETGMKIKSMKDTTSKISPDLVGFLTKFILELSS